MRELATRDVARLLRWFEGARRDLPWRRTGDPYAIWVSEVMLQQTRVEVVIPYFERWIQRFPDPATLAAASLEEVLQHWSGLGYYRRARMLHQGAAVVCEQHDGVVPSGCAALRALPGIGEYTAAAIASLAQRERVAVVDGNVKRVAARIQDLDLGQDDPQLHRATREWAQALHDCAPQQSHPGRLNEALMELGATVCTPRGPSCADCPWSGVCICRQRGQPEERPGPRRAKAWTDLTLVYGLGLGAAGVCLVQRAAGWNPGMWEPPSHTLAAAAADQAAIRQEWPHRDHPLGEELGELRHTITHHRIRARVFALTSWPTADERPTDNIALTGLARKILRRFSGEGEPMKNT